MAGYLLVSHFNIFLYGKIVRYGGVGLKSQKKALFVYSLLTWFDWKLKVRFYRQRGRSERNVLMYFWRENYFQHRVPKQICSLICSLFVDNNYVLSSRTNLKINKIYYFHIFLRFETHISNWSLFRQTEAICHNYCQVLGQVP